MQCGVTFPMKATYLIRLHGLVGETRPGLQPVGLFCIMVAPAKWAGNSPLEEPYCIRRIPVGQQTRTRG